MTLIDLLRSERAPNNVAELVWYCLEEKASHEDEAEEASLTKAEELIFRAWWLCGSLMNHSAREVLVRLEFGDLAPALMEIGLPTHSQAVASHDHQYLDAHLTELADGIYDFIRRNASAIQIDNFLGHQVDWLDQQIAMSSD